MYSIERLPVLSETLPWGRVEEIIQQRPTLVVGIGFIFLLTFLFRSLSNSPDKNAPFKNHKGEKIKEIKKDTRFLRFVNGAGLSKEGKELAGDEPYLVRNGPHRELVISSPAQMQEFLRKDYRDHKKAHNMNLGDYAGRIYGQCLGEQNGQTWKMMRGHFEPDFSHQSAMGMIPLFNTEISRWIRELPSKALRADLPKGGFAEDAVKISKLLSFRLISLTLYGEAFNEQMFAKLVDLNQLYDKLVMTALARPRTSSKWYNMLPTASKRQMEDFHRQWEEFNHGVIRSARERNLSCPAERIYRGVDRAHEMKDAEYFQTIIEILFANIDINGHVLACLLSNLAADSAFQDKLCSEIAAHKNSEVPFNVASYAAKQDTLLHCLTLESVRLLSSVFFSPPELTGANKNMNGYFIPGGTPVVIDVNRLNTHPSTWGDDALVFRPERFQEMSPSQWRHSMIRFGIASGRCLGKNMADLILKMTTISVMETYQLKKVNSVAAQKENQKGPPTSEVEFQRR